MGQCRRGRGRGRERCLLAVRDVTAVTMCSHKHVLSFSFLFLLKRYCWEANTLQSHGAVFLKPLPN